MPYLVSFEILILLGLRITVVECIAMFLSSLNVILKPITLSCGHSGCEKCLANLARIATPKCHTCRTPFTANGLKLNVIMDTMTRDLNVKCLSGGCEWSGIYPEAEDHYNECPKLEERCKNEHCTHVAARETMPAHEDVCPKQKLPCMDCKLLVPRDGIQHHHDFMCVNSPVQCPLECGTLLPRYVDYSQFLAGTVDFSKQCDMVHERDAGLSLIFTIFKLHDVPKKMLNRRPAKELVSRF